MRLQNKTVLLTGASKGIGTFIAKTLALESAIIIGVARSSEGLETTKAAVEELGGRFHSVPFDLKNINQLPDLISKVESTIGEVDILVNNAGIELYNEYHHYSADDVSDVLNINLHAPMELTRLLLPSML